MNVKLERLPHSRIKLTITVPADIIKKHYDAAVKKVGESVEIKGFRKGHAPAAMVLQKAGNSSVLQEMLDLAVPETYFQAIKSLHSEGKTKDKDDIVPVEQPKIDVKELKGLETGTVPSEMTYVAEVDVMPEVTVGDYKKIRIKPKTAPTKIEKKEVDGTIEELKKVYGNEWLQKLSFKTEEDARKAIEENIKQQKIFQAKADTFDLIIEELLKKAKTDVPEAFIHNEIHRMEHQIEMQAKSYGMTFDDWLKSEKKTHDDIHKQWRPQAEKAAKVGLILGTIAEQEGIDPTRNDASRLVLEKLHTYAVK